MKHIAANSKASLLKDFRSGNPGAFSTLYLEHYPSLLDFANRVLKNTEQAEDFVAESFVKCWQKRAAFESLKGIHNFLFIVTRNACFSYLEQCRRRVLSRKELAYLSSDKEDMESDYQVRQELVAQALKEADRLPPKMKKVFNLIYQEGLSTREVMKAMNLSVNTIGTHKKNALLRVKERMSKKGLIAILL